MSKHEDTLRLACGKWVSAETAEQIIRAAAPRMQTPDKYCKPDGSIRKTWELKCIGWSKLEQLGADPALPLTVYEWDLESLILRLLICGPRSVASICEFYIKAGDNRGGPAGCARA